MNEADRLKEFELRTLERLERLEEYSQKGAIRKNADAMKATIEEWNKMFVEMDIRVRAMENNYVSILRTVKDIQDSNTLALQKLRGTGPTAP